MFQKLTFHDDPFSEMEALEAFEFDDDVLLDMHDADDAFPDVETPKPAKRAAGRRTSKRQGGSSSLTA